MKGKDLQATIIHLATLNGWRAVHFESVRVTYPGGRITWKTPFSGQGAGFPDIIAVRGERMVAIEVKGRGDSLKPEQQQWLDALAALPCCDVFVATPKDWLSDDSRVRRLLA